MDNDQTTGTYFAVSTYTHTYIPDADVSLCAYCEFCPSNVLDSVRASIVVCWVNINTWIGASFGAITLILQ